MAISMGEHLLSMASMICLFIIMHYLFMSRKAAWSVYPQTHSMGIGLNLRLESKRFRFIPFVPLLSYINKCYCLLFGVAGLNKR